MLPTHAILFSAGLGSRMRPLTLDCPKPLLEVAGHALIEHHLLRLAALGIYDVVINVSYLADKIINRLGSGENYGVKIHYSHELQPLEAAGGIQQALRHLGTDRFLVINADVWIQMDFKVWFKQMSGEYPVELLLVDNPDFHPNGDFYLGAAGVLDESQGKRLTYAGIGVYAVDLFKDLKPGVIKLAPLLRQWIPRAMVHGVHHHGPWSDVGTPERLAKLREAVLNCRFL